MSLQEIQVLWTIGSLLIEKNFLDVNSLRQSELTGPSGFGRSLHTTYCEEITCAKHEYEQEGRKFVLTNRNKTTLQSAVSKRKSTYIISWILSLCKAHYSWPQPVPRRLGTGKAHSTWPLCLCPLTAGWGAYQESVVLFVASHYVNHMIFPFVNAWNMNGTRKSCFCKN